MLLRPGVIPSVNLGPNVEMRQSFFAKEKTSSRQWVYYSLSIVLFCKIFHIKFNKKVIPILIKMLSFRSMNVPVASTSTEASKSEDLNIEL